MKIENAPPFNVALRGNFNRELAWLPAILGVLAVGMGVALGAALELFSPVLAFAGIAGIAALYLSITHLEWGMVLLVFMTWTRFTDVVVKYHGVPSVTKMFVPMLMGLILVRWLIYKEKPTGWRPTAIMLALYVLVGALGLLYAETYWRMNAALSIIVKDVLIAIVIVILLKNAVIWRRAVWALVLSGTLLGTIAVIQYITSDFTNNFWGFGQAQSLGLITGEVDGYRISGPIGDANYFAHIMVVLVPLAFNRMIFERNIWLRVLAGWSFTACVLAVIFTFSRGGFVGLVAVLAVMLIMNPPRLSVFVFSIPIAFFILQFIPPVYTERISTITSVIPGMGQQNEALNEGSFRGRTSHIFVGINMFADHPIFGVGLDHFGYHYQTYSREIGLNTATRQGRAAHNRWLEVAAEQGLVGLGIYCTMVFVMFRNVFRARRRFNQAGQNDYASMATAFGIALVGFFVTITFLNDAYPRFFWVLFSIAMALPNIVSAELDPPQQAPA